MNSAKIPFNDTGEFAEIHFSKDFYSEAGLNSPNATTDGVLDFTSFQVKLCMGTSNTAKVPKIKSLRGIATA